jgi:Pretoxin HINT domain
LNWIQEGGSAQDFRDIVAVDPARFASAAALVSVYYAPASNNARLKSQAMVLAASTEGAAGVDYLQYNVNEEQVKLQKEYVTADYKRRKEIDAEESDLRQLTRVIQSYRDTEGTRQTPEDDANFIKLALADATGVGDAVATGLAAKGLPGRRGLSASEVEALLGGRSRPEFCSFAPETLVLLGDGTRRAIASLRIGENVASRNEADGRTTVRPITAAFAETHTDRIKIAVLNTNDATSETITTTRQHRFWVTDTGFVHAATLKVGDRLGRFKAQSPLLAAASRYNDASGALLVKAITIEASGVVPWTAYNLTIADDHTYFVGRSDIWVHNDCYKSLPDEAVTTSRKTTAGQDIFEVGSREFYRGNDGHYYDQAIFPPGEAIRKAGGATGDIALDPRLPEPKAGLEYWPDFVGPSSKTGHEPTPNNAKSQQEGYRAELLEANKLAAEPGTTVVSYGNGSGVRGNDLVSVKVTGDAVEVALSDTKYRSDRKRLDESTTYNGKFDNPDTALGNAVENARKDIDASNLPQDVKQKALDQLREGNFTTRTVPYGKAYGGGSAVWKGGVKQ